MEERSNWQSEVTIRIIRKRQKQQNMKENKAGLTENHVFVLSWRRDAESEVGVLNRNSSEWPSSAKEKNQHSASYSNFAVELPPGWRGCLWPPLLLPDIIIQRNLSRLLRNEERKERSGEGDGEMDPGDTHLLHFFSFQEKTMLSNGRHPNSPADERRLACEREQEHSGLVVWATATARNSGIETRRVERNHSVGFWSYHSCKFWSSERVPLSYESITPSAAPIWNRNSCWTRREDTLKRTYKQSH